MQASGMITGGIQLIDTAALKRIAESSQCFYAVTERLQGIFVSDRRCKDARLEVFLLQNPGPDELFPEDACRSEQVLHQENQG